MNPSSFQHIDNHMTPDLEPSFILLDTPLSLLFHLAACILTSTILSQASFQVTIIQEARSRTFFHFARQSAFSTLSSCNLHPHFHNVLAGFQVTITKGARSRTFFHCARHFTFPTQALRKLCLVYLTNSQAAVTRPQDSCSLWTDHVSKE